MKKVFTKAEIMSALNTIGLPNPDDAVSIQINRTFVQVIYFDGMESSRYVLPSGEEVDVQEVKERYVTYEVIS